MNLYFSKSRFLNTADISTKRILNGHLDVLDGMKVEIDEEGEYNIPHYIVNGEDFILYPVYGTWCSKEKQGELF